MKRTWTFCGNRSRYVFEWLGQCIYIYTDLLQTLEVAFARVYNWDVAQRRKEREGGESIEDKKRGSPNG